MKVILLRDVAKIGRKAQVVDVPDGYARNQLIPKGMAELATPANLKRIERQNAIIAASEEAAQNRFSDALAVLKEKVVKVAIEVNEKGHAFKAVSEKEIAEAAKEAGAEIEKAMILLDSPIKEVGEHKVYLVSGSEKAEFNIEVIKK